MWGQPDYGRFGGIFNSAYAPRGAAQPITPLSTGRASADNTRGTPGATQTPDTTTPAAPAGGTTPAQPDLNTPLPGSTNTLQDLINMAQNPPAATPAPTPGQAQANPGGFAASFSSPDPNITAALNNIRQQQYGAANPGSAPAGYGTGYFNDPANRTAEYAGSYNSNVPNPNAPPPGSTPTGVGDVFVLPWGGTWIRPGADQQAAFRAYQDWARRQPGFSYNGVR